VFVVQIATPRLAPGARDVQAWYRRKNSAIVDCYSVVVE